jgi:hypothetical protein
MPSQAGPRFSAKQASLQLFAPHTCTTEELAPSLWPVDAVHRIAIFDIRTCNLDRNEDNMLVRMHPPAPAGGALVTSATTSVTTGGTGTASPRMPARRTMSIDVPSTTADACRVAARRTMSIDSVPPPPPRAPGGAGAGLASASTTAAPASASASAPAPVGSAAAAAFAALSEAADQQGPLGTLVGEWARYLEASTASGLHTRLPGAGTAPRGRTASHSEAPTPSFSSSCTAHCVPDGSGSSSPRHAVRTPKPSPEPSPPGRRRDARGRRISPTAGRVVGGAGARRTSMPEPASLCGAPLLSAGVPAGSSEGGGEVLDGGLLSASFHTPPRRRRVRRSGLPGSGVSGDTEPLDDSDGDVGQVREYGCSFV